MTYREAQERAEHYQINVFTDDGLWYGRIVEMPSVMNHGKTPAAAIKAARELLATTLAYHIEESLPIVPPISETRDRQINVRVSGYEKQALERAAKQQGFRGIGDFVRHAALAKT
ncbi:MAG: type II toxin-antitoxin system HicB family antitoxin [Planctomycetota bacterium]